MRPTTAVVTVLLFLATGWAADTRRNQSDAMNMGLRGPVHTVKSSRDPLPDWWDAPTIYSTIPRWEPWMVFGPTGTLIESASSLSSEGTPERVTRFKKEPQGSSQTTDTGDGQTTSLRSESTFGPVGPIETRDYLDGILQTFTRYSYDAKGNATELSMYDRAGKLLNRFFSRFDEAGRLVDSENHGENDQFRQHIVNTYGAHGDLLGRDFLDATGRIFISMAFRDARLTSIWRAPNCRGESLGFGVSGSDRTVAYNFRDDCSLEVIVQKHQGHIGEVENNEVERYNEAGDLLEKLTFQYDRDLYGNWTRRDVSLWDSRTNSMIPIQEDTRTITYYH